MNIAKRLTTLFIPGLIILLDQWTKTWVFINAQEGRVPFRLTPFCNIVLAWNKGVSFGILNNWGPHATQIILTITLIICATILILWWRTPKLLIACVWALVLGGAIGNIIDRYQFGAVLDFIDIYWRHWHWWTFNIADAAITIGVGWMVIMDVYSSTLKSANKHRKEP